MNLRWNLENWGYKHLLRDDNGIQFAFAKELDSLAQSGQYSYVQKLIILLKLCFQIHIMGNTPWDIWEKKRLRLSYPEWKDHTVEEVTKCYEKISKEKRLLIQWQDVFVFSVFDHAEPENYFLAIAKACGKGDAAKDLCDFYIYNKQLLNLIKENQQIDRYILFTVNEWKKWKSVWRERFCHLGTPIKYEKESGYRVCIDDTAWTSAEETFVLRCSNRFKDVKADMIFPNIKSSSRYYRSYLGTSPVLKYYNALMACKFHLPTSDMSFFYEMGYKYAGILCCGVCHWLKQLVQGQGIDKLLFCSRDGEMFYKIYNKFFPSVTDYLYVSRRAVSEITFEDHPEEYINNYWLHRAMNRNIRFLTGEELEDFGLAFMSKYYESYDINPREYLTPKTYEKIKRMVLEHQEEVLVHLKQYKAAGLSYMEKMLAHREKIAVFDLGWHGTIFRYLQNISREYGWDNELVGALVAATGDETISNYIHLGGVFTYLFADDKIRRDKNIGIPLGTKQVFCFEKMFSSPQASLKHYTLTADQEVKFEFKEKNRYLKQIEEIHRGITDFADDFMPFVIKFDLQIQAEDAWLPMSDFINNPQLVDLFYKLILQEYS